MSIDDHAADAPGHENAVALHRTDDHGEEHGHDDHAHGGGGDLGSIDLAAWGAGIAGVAIAIVIALCLALATSSVA